MKTRTVCRTFDLRWFLGCVVAGTLNAIVVFGTIALGAWGAGGFRSHFFADVYDNSNVPAIVELVSAERPLPDEWATLWGTCDYVVVFADDTYLACADPAEADEILSWFPYLAQMVDARGSLADMDFAVYFGLRLWKGLNPRLLTGVISGGAEGEAVPMRVWWWFDSSPVFFLPVRPPAGTQYTRLVA